MYVLGTIMAKDTYVKCLMALAELFAALLGEVKGAG